MQLLWPETSAPPDLAANVVHVWSVPLDAVRTTWDEQWAILAADERERAERFRLERARRRFVAARAALRTLLGQYSENSPAEIILQYAANGKPRLQPMATEVALQFNVAHSEEMALIAFARGCEVGVDIEHLRNIPHWREIAERYFHPREVAQLIALSPGDQQPAFTCYWTAKEAVLKAIGVGVTQSLSFFVDQCRPPKGSWVEVPRRGDDGAHCWLESLAPDENYVAALACLGAQRDACCFQFRF
jgi:4'-phosphopantetheinyl transferase